MENYSHITLSDDETKDALREARKKKHFKMEQLKYREKLLVKPEYPKFDHQTIFNFAHEKAIELYEGFVLDNDNISIFELLSYYFSGDTKFEEIGDYSLKKGIMLLGPIGCGKTTILKAFQLNTFNPYGFVSSRNVANSYSKYNPLKDEESPIEKYSKLLAVHPHLNFGNEHIGMCFDDLGTEDVKKNFGNESNVMADIILNRYDNISSKNKTHFTANLTSDQIDEFYGNRVRSRLREMCNVISFDPESADRRQ